jgi:hypothetical protein
MIPDMPGTFGMLCDSIHRAKSLSIFLSPASFVMVIDFLPTFLPTPLCTHAHSFP